MTDFQTLQTMSKDAIWGHMLELSKEFTDEEGGILLACVQDFRDEVDFSLWTSEAQQVWTKAVSSGLIFAIATVEYLCSSAEEEPFYETITPIAFDQREN